MIKSLILSFCAVLFLSSPLYAGPASPDAIEISQPDGTTFTSRIHGDEYQNWTVSESTGHTILHNKSSGYWEYAEQKRDGTLRPGGMKVRSSGTGIPPGLPKGLRPPRNLMHEQQMKKSLNEISQQRFLSPALNASLDQSGTISPGADAAASGGDWVPVPVSGTRKILIVLISFKDRVIQTSPANWYTSVFDESSKSITKFYKENSFSLLTVSPAAHTQSGNPAGVVSVTVADNHPDYGGNYVYDTETTILNHALAQAATYVNFASFDANGNGKLEQSELTVYFIYAGYEASGSSLQPNVWAHAWSGSITAGTKTISRWAQSGELNNFSAQHPMGVIAHELGHALCGLPDLYDVSEQNRNRAMGAFSLMSVGSWGRDSVDTHSGMTPASLDAWSREFLGWSTPVLPAMDGTMSLDHVLASRDSVYKLVVPTTSSTEYFLIEHRRPFNWDTGLKRWLGNSWQGGLLILHIDNTAGSASNNDINSYETNSVIPGHQGVVPVQASVLSCNMLLVGSQCDGNASTLFYSGNTSSWTAGTTPNSNYYNGTSTGFSLTNISVPSSIMTGTLQVPPRLPDAMTGFASNVTSSAARLNGIVNSNNAVTSVTFEYGLTLSYGNSAYGGSLTAVSGGVSVVTDVTGLSCNTSYHFRVKAVNSVGTWYGNDMTFTTKACAPLISAMSGNAQVSIIASSPVLGGNAITTVDSYTIVSSNGRSITDSVMPIVFSELSNNIPYTFTAVANNSLGSGASSVLSSATPGMVINNESNSVGYATITAAYEALLNKNATIRIQAGAQVGEFLKCDSDTIVLDGGYDVSFITNSGAPSVLSKLIISGGTARAQNIIVSNPP